MVRLRWLPSFAKVRSKVLRNLLHAQNDSIDSSACSKGGRLPSFVHLPAGLVLGSAAWQARQGIPEV